MTIKVKSFPHISHFRSEISGIATVVKKYFQLLPNYGIELVEPDATTYDLVAAHAGWTGPDVDVCHLHGIYWSADYNAPSWEYEVNSRIVEAVRHAKQVIVPSHWVAEAFQRDMRFTPHVIGHGVNVEEWQHKKQNKGYILGYSKNRAGTDVCDPSFLNHLAPRFAHLQFLTTFAPQHAARNIEAIGTMPQDKYKKIVQQAAVYISSVKETFGCGTLEAMAAGIPVLGVRAGGNLELVEHGHTGYLYEPDNYEDMAAGLDYCLKHRKVLGMNAQEMAKGWTWESVAEKVAEVYRLAIDVEDRRAMTIDSPSELMLNPLVSVIIPCHNKGSTIRRAIDSVKVQKLNNLECFIILDRCTDNSLAEVQQATRDDRRFSYHEVNHGNVADTRNFGANLAKGLFYCFLDGDDWIENNFLLVCAKEMIDNPVLGAAYTGLTWHKPDGTTGLSPWPTEWNYNDQLVGKNQIPTCSLIRAETWNRLGGQRSRYCGNLGAGAEDGEFYLRMGAYGWAGKKVTDEGLFHYSWMSGLVTGNPNYSEPDYKVWHPWTKDGKHPFASYATPKKLSHPVRQYDEPEISVIIPVGPGHEKDVINALDSLEAQTFRKWEAILIDNTGNVPPYQDGYWITSLMKAYPYVKALFSTAAGAGYARNRGASVARAPLLLFLDADDTLHPDALDKMLARWNQTQQMVYTDYVGHAFIDPQLAQKMQQSNRLMSYNPNDGEAIIAHKAFTFDCARALRQPEGIDKIYIWNLITTLLPKAWHDEIGGFDESMETWEDWDYWLRLARKGHCFTHLEEPLVRYRFYTGKRRDLASPDNEEGRQKAQNMLSYMRQKYSREQPMACGCKDKGSNGIATTAQLQAANGEGMADSAFVKARYVGGRGNKHLWGTTFFEHNPGPPARKAPGGGYKMYYGYGQEGLETLVHRRDIEGKPHDWMIIMDRPKVEATAQQPLKPPTSILEGIKEGFDSEAFKAASDKAVKAIAGEQFDFQLLPGVGAAIAQRLKQAGLTDRNSLLSAGLEGLTKIEGITDKRAEAILRYLEN